MGKSSPCNKKHGFPLRRKDSYARLSAPGLRDWSSRDHVRLSLHGGVRRRYGIHAIDSVAPVFESRSHASVFAVQCKEIRDIIVSPRAEQCGYCKADRIHDGDIYLNTRMGPGYYDNRYW